MKRFYVFSLLMLVFLFASAQDRTISGTVTDVGGETLPSVNVVVSGTTIGTVTDIDGKYTLKIPADTKEIVFSFVGFTDKKVAIGSDNVINCTLSEGLELEELVVTGLGIRKEKKALGYAVTTIGGQDVELKPEA
ncbi:MAG: carboxypeptidase-like regulatory domain-containing protein, partial [Chitinophagales bacterium]